MLAATEDGSGPFWSPDGKSIGFFAEGKLKTIQLAGGPARVVCDAVENATGTWIRADVILFAPGPTGAVSEVSVEHGTVRQVTRVDRSSGELRHVRPTSLPDGRHFVYLASRKDQLVATLASVDGTDAVPLGTVQSHVVAAPSDLVVFVRDGTLLAQRLDVAAGRLTGDATVLAEGLTQPGGSGSVDGRFSTSPAMLVYLKVRRGGFGQSELRIFDRAGKTVGTVGEPAEYTAPSLSPDGMRLAVARGIVDPGQGRLGLRSRGWQSFAADARCGRRSCSAMVAGWAVADVQLQSTRCARHLQAACRQVRVPTSSCSSRRPASPSTRGHATDAFWCTTRAERGRLRFCTSSRSSETAVLSSWPRNLECSNTVIFLPTVG